MKKGWKIFWIVCAVLFGMGVIFCAAGAVMGGSLMGISSAYEQEWEDRYGIDTFEDDEDNIPDDADDIGETADTEPQGGTADIMIQGENTEGNADEVTGETYTDIRRLDAELSYIDLEVEEYDGRQVKVQKEGIDSDMLQDIHCRVEGDELKIELKDKKKWKNIFNNNHNPATLTVFVPKGSLKEADLSVGAGILHISELHVDELDVEVGAGQAIVENVTARELDIVCGAGEAEITADVQNETKIECGVGSVTYHAAGAQEDYNYELDCGIGEVRVGGMEFGGIVKEQHVANPGASRKMEIECGIGEVNVTFEK